ncbi:MAG: homocysteine S-methyltransferase family protein [Pseudomonadota bacterium]
MQILDGGMGGELIKRGASSSTELWSAQALLDAPEVVRAVHQDYIDAGARLIITNSYSTIPSYLGKLGMSERFEELTALAARIARETADAADAPVQVAGSLPPLSESYRADLVPPDEEARPIYDRLVAVLAPYVDVFLCETMSCAREARVAATAAQAGNKPIYVAWTLDEQPGQGLRSGETIAAAYAAVAELPLAGLLFNCTAPEAIESALIELRGLTDLPIGAYPNLLHIPEGWTLDDADIPSGRRDMSVDEFLGFCDRFAAAGATMLGGCCGIGPEYIAALSARHAS